MSEEIENIIDELDNGDGLPLGTTVGFSYVCSQCVSEDKVSNTTMVSPPVTLVTRMPIYDEKGQILSPGKRRLLVAMVCDNGHELIASREFELEYDMGEGHGREI